MKYFSILIFLIAFQVAFSQESADIIEPEHIKTVTLRSTNSNKYAPIISLGESFLISFDDLEADQKDYFYKIEHFNFEWEPSGISDREFIAGYDQDRIRDFENSFNTLQFFTHYKVSFPNRNTKIIISGNYKISILNDDDEILFTRRFIVYEPKVNVGVSVHRSRDVSESDTKQTVQFIINHPNLLINNPKQEIKTVLLQNNDWNTAITDLEPQYYRGTQMLYKYIDRTNFWAGNEFHNFDSKSVRNSTLTIARVESGPELYHTILYTNEERIDRPYTLYPDINGNYVIRNIRGEDDAIDSDYTWVFFTLESLEDLEGKRIYVNGSFNNWRFDSSNEMTYNKNIGLYETKLLLKQGFYNYQYITINQSDVISNHDIDGSFYQTENEYSVLVYYKKFGSRYDSIIGYGKGNSENIQN
ncbi:MAG: DUF5103 domain-containing protein [Urechidicola sp.]